MRSDRRAAATALGLVEAVREMSETGSGTPVGAQRARSADEIAELFEVAGREGEAIRQLGGCVALFDEVQRAKEALMRLSPAEVRAGLERRRLALGNRR